MMDLLQELGIPRDKVFFVSADGNIVLINDDFLRVDYIKPNSIDLIVTSPPYNVDVHYEGYRDKLPYKKYLEFTEKWLRKAYELLKPDGRMCLNIPIDTSRGREGEGFQSVYADVVAIAKEGWAKVCNDHHLERGEHIQEDRLGHVCIPQGAFRHSASGGNSCFIQEVLAQAERWGIRHNAGGVQGVDLRVMDVPRREPEEGRAPSTIPH